MVDIIDDFGTLFYVDIIDDFGALFYVDIIDDIATIIFIFPPTYFDFQIIIDNDHHFSTSFNYRCAIFILYFPPKRYVSNVFPICTASIVSGQSLYLP